MSVIGGKADIARTSLDVRFCEGFRMPAIDGGAAHLGGRRPKASKERNRDGGTYDGAAAKGI